MDKETNPLVLEGLDSVPTPSLTLEPQKRKNRCSRLKKWSLSRRKKKN